MMPNKQEPYKHLPVLITFYRNSPVFISPVRIMNHALLRDQLEYMKSGIIKELFLFETFHCNKACISLLGILFAERAKDKES